METVFSNDRIEVTHLPGTSGTAIISFTGIGMGLGAVQTEEFRKSLSGTENDLLFVKDKERLWYNGCLDETCDVLNQKLDALGTEATVTLGNSMGGFGAIIFAGRLRKCNRAIAFAAQSAIDPSLVPWENRWDRYVGGVHSWDHLDATRMLAEPVKYYAFFGADDIQDVRHAQRLASTKWPNLTICIVSGCGHDVSTYLRKANILGPLIDSLILNEGTYSGWMAFFETIPHRIVQ